MQGLIKETCRSLGEGYQRIVELRLGLWLYAAEESCCVSGWICSSASYGEVCLESSLVGFGG